MSMFISLCLFWISSTTVKAQISDSVIVVKPQPAEVIQWTTYKAKRQKKLPRAVLKADIGYGWRTATTSNELNDDMKKYYSHLKSGFVWDASFDFFFNDMFGIRMAFYQYLTSHSEHAYNTDTGKQGMLATKDRITYSAPAFVFRLPFGQNSWIFDANAGMGYIGYYEKSTFVDEYYSIKGASVGFQTGVGLDYKITTQLHIGINMQITSGVIWILHYDENGMKSTKTFDFEEGGEGLGQISLGIGIRYYFK